MMYMCICAFKHSVSRELILNSNSNSTQLSTGRLRRPRRLRVRVRQPRLLHQHRLPAPGAGRHAGGTQGDHGLRDAGRPHVRPHLHLQLLLHPLHHGHIQEVQARVLKQGAAAGGKASRLRNFFFDFWWLESQDGGDFKKSHTVRYRTQT